MSSERKLPGVNLRLTLGVGFITLKPRSEAEKRNILYVCLGQKSICTKYLTLLDFLLITLVGASPHSSMSDRQ